MAPGSLNTGYDPFDLHLDLGLDQWRLRFAEIIRNNTGSGAGVANALDPTSKGKSERTVIDLSWSDPEFADNWGLGFDGSFHRYVQTFPTPLVLFPAGANLSKGTFTNGMIGAPDTWERTTRLSTYTTYSGFNDHALRVGMGIDEMNLYKTLETKNFTFTAAGVPVPYGQLVQFPANLSFLTPHERVDTYVLAQDEWQFARDWTLTAGLRYDKFSDFGGTTNPRLALVWDAAKDVTAKFLAGQAFRAPSFNELYSANNPVNFGNTSLTPEPSSATGVR